MQDSSTAGNLPLSLRIFPPRAALWWGLSASFGLSLVFLAVAPAASAGRSWALVAAACAGLFCGWRLLVQLPLIEASEYGIAIWFHGPYRNPYFTPWSRVRCVVLTRSAPSGAALEGRGRQALGVQLQADARLAAPPLGPQAEVAVAGAPGADLAWSSRSIAGKPAAWVALLQQMHRVYGAAAGPLAQRPAAALRPAQPAR